MRLRSLALAAIPAALLAAPLSAVAQEGRALVVGTFSGVTTLALLQPLNGRFSIRPDLSLVYQDASSPFGGPTESWNLALGLSLLRYAPGEGPLRTYVVTRVATFTGFGPDVIDTPNLDLSLAYGAHGLVGERFGLFGEAGLQFDYNESPFGSTSRIWRSVARFGGTLRF